LRLQGLWQKYFYDLIRHYKGTTMTLTEYFINKTHGTKAKMAEDLGITRTWLSLILSGTRLPSPVLATAIEKYTKGKVKRKILRPDIFGV
jgi:DNA-binding transcriptional regulator YdaS (Cro superfamily)